MDNSILRMRGQRIAHAGRYAALSKCVTCARRAQGSRDSARAIRRGNSAGSGVEPRARRALEPAHSRSADGCRIIWWRGREFGFAHPQIP